MQLTIFIKTFLEKWKLPLTVVLSILFFGLVAKFAMTHYRKIYFHTSKDIANGQERPNDVTIYFFFADWCKHCQKAKPVWEAFQHQYDQTAKNDRRIVCNPVDCTDVSDEDTKELLKQFRVNSYPTILMLKDQKIIRFDASVSKNNLDEFVRKMM